MNTGGEPFGAGGTGVTCGRGVSPDGCGDSVSVNAGADLDPYMIASFCGSTVVVTGCSAAGGPATGGASGGASAGAGVVKAPARYATNAPTSVTALTTAAT